ncbi:MAG: hypothetical protein ACK5MP_13365, partial [Nostocoides sp.]
MTIASFVVAMVTTVAGIAALSPAGIFVGRTTGQLVNSATEVAVSTGLFCSGLDRYAPGLGIAGGNPATDSMCMAC